MRHLLDMDTIQIEVTNVCRNMCSNCTRYVGHYKPWFMPFEKYKEAVDSMEGYPKMIGMQGGEPLLHPEFEKFCEYLLTRFPKDNLGLWTTLPTGYEHYRKIICKTFKHIFINDHSRNDIYHHPSMMAIKDIIKDEKLMWYKINNCWTQMSWSASINPLGAYFCEMAASMAMLYNDSETAWKIEHDWWYRPVWNFKEQIEKWCPNCGMPCNLKRRKSTDTLDDISISTYLKLKDVSPRVKQELVKIILNPTECEKEDMQPLGAYRDTDYRNNIAKRYGIYTYVNDENFWTPVLLESVKVIGDMSYIEMLKERQKNEG